VAAQFVVENVTYALADGVYYEVDRDFVSTLNELRAQRVAELDQRRLSQQGRERLARRGS